MKIQVLSDLHLEENNFTIQKSEADVIVLAGDIDEGAKAVSWIEKQTDKPVVYVAGNHEYYGHFCPELKYELRKMTAAKNIHCLENQSVIIDGVRFLGCTLWTNTAHGLRYRRISKIRKISNDKIIPSPFSSDDSKQLFEESIGWLSYQLQDRKYPTVVVTHHAPSFDCNILDEDKFYIEPHQSDILFAYMSDLNDFILEHQPELWIHGHLHVTKEFNIGQTKVCCNALGRSPFNQEFKNQYIVSI